MFTFCPNKSADQKQKGARLATLVLWIYSVSSCDARLTQRLGVQGSVEFSQSAAGLLIFLVEEESLSIMCWNLNLLTAMC